MSNMTVSKSTVFLSAIKFLTYCTRGNNRYGTTIQSINHIRVLLYENLRKEKNKTRVRVELASLSWLMFISLI